MYRVYAITDIGKEREQNQDGFLIDGVHCENAEHREIYYETDGEFVHVALCDGVGSTQFATYAVEKAQEYICNHLRVTDEQELEKMIVDMNEYVYSSLKETEKENGACTIAGIVMIQNTALIYNIGDSPAYSINNGYLEKQTTEDTGVALFGEQTSLDGEVQIKPPLIQSIGTNKLIDLVHIKKKQDDVAFLLCTDGITDMLSLDEMEEILESSNSIKEVAQRFVDEANDRGGFDNSTIIILVDEED
jgi:serine/threonine protein phosphatase PrpC